MKKLFLLLAALGTLAFTSCELEENYHDDFQYYEVPYLGVMTVIPLDGGDTFTWDNTEVGLGEERDGTLTLWLYDVRFVPQMPPMTMAIPLITYAETPALTSLLGDDIVPYMGQKPYPKYLVTNLSGTVANRQLNISFNCIGFRVTFIGNEYYK